MSAGCLWVTEDQFARPAPLLSNDTSGVLRVDDRRMISGIVHMLRTGCRWKDAPDRHGPHQTLYDRVVSWAAEGVWESVFTRLAANGRAPASLMICWPAGESLRWPRGDATHVKAHRSTAGGKGGPNAGDRTVPRRRWTSPTERSVRSVDA